MKLLITTLLLFGTFVSQAQKAEDYINYIKASVDLDIKKVVYKNLDLSGDQIESFDPLFQEYLEDEGTLVLDRLLKFESYAKRMSTLSIEQLDDMNEELFKNELDQAQLEKKYYKKFTNKIGIKKATQFFYVKRNIDNLVENAKLSFLAN